MRKLLFALVAVLFLCGVATATTIPSAVNGKDGREIWITSVYNNHGATMDAGDVAVWEIDASTGDDDNYVQTTTTADTHLVAGVIWPVDILAGDTGLMVIRGPVPVDTVTCPSGIIAGVALCSSGTGGAAQACSNPTTGNNKRFGFAVGSCSGASVQAFVNPL